MMDLFYLVPMFGSIALIYTVVQSAWLSKQDAGNERMRTISGHIADGAMAFLHAEYRILTYFVIVVAILLALMGFSNSNSHWTIGISFILDAVLCSAAGFFGMNIATKENVITFDVAKTSLARAFKIFFTGR